MLHNDRLTLAILFCRIYLKGFGSQPNLDDEFNFFLRSKEGVINATVDSLDMLNNDQKESMLKLSSRLVCNVIYYQKKIEFVKQSFRVTWFIFNNYLILKFEFKYYF